LHRRDRIEQMPQAPSELMEFPDDKGVAQGQFCKFLLPYVNGTIDPALSEPRVRLIK
jgi:hypothetical protein